MDLKNARSVLDKVSGFGDASSVVGEAWEYIEGYISELENEIETACFYEQEKVKRFAISCVEAEPEYPGPIPEAMHRKLSAAIENKDMDMLVDMLRATVRLTKEGIANRIRTG